jgi:drug/metabolite transporter (DMT)-like permease
MVVLYSNSGAEFLMLMCMVNSLGGAFMDVVVDGLMVINSRSDPNAGSEDLQSYSWMMYGIGGVVGCTLSGWLLSGLDAQGEPDGQPYICFLVMAFFGCAVGFSGLFIDKAEMINMGVYQRTKFVFSQVG